MKKTKFASLKVSFVLSTLIFAIAFVSIFTYLPIYSKAIELTEQELRKDLKLQSKIIKSVLPPAQTLTTDQKKNALKKELINLWKDLALDAKGETLYLTYKNPNTNNTEIFIASSATALNPSNQHLLYTSLYKVLNHPSGLHLIQTDSKQIVFAAYTTLVSQQWGLVIQKEAGLISGTIYEAISYTLFASLLITLVSWLILRIKYRSIQQREETLEERYQSLLFTTNDWVWEINHQGQFTYSSEQVETLLGYTASEVTFTGMNNLFDPGHSQSNQLVWKQKAMLNEAFNNLEIAFRHKKGQTVHLLMSGYPLFDKHHKPIGFRGVSHDISEIKQREQKIINQAHFDTLTELVNRQHFIDQLAKHLLGFKKEKAYKPSALFFIDLDGFKKVNDRHGHELGDALLKVIGKRLHSLGREEDVVARFGGDEFVILFKCVENMTTKEFIKKLEAYTQRMIHAINEPVNIDNLSAKVGASVGIAMIPQDGKTVTEVLNHADIAMYHAKSRNSNTYEFYNLNTQKVVDEKIKTVSELEAAIKQEEFELYYQLQFSDNRVVGMEALLRWHHPESRKTLSAAQFIPQLKDIQQTLLIDEWVINKVASDIAEIKSKLQKPIPVSINLSTQEMFEGDLAELVEKAIKRHFITGHAFNIEVSEDILAGNFKQTRQTVNKLSKLGVNIYIDHFGTGFLSLSNLQTLPIKAIKIDKSFIDNVATSHNDLQMCRTIVQLAKSMDFHVIAEGIETSVQKDILSKEGCDIMQGYIYAQPMPLHKVLNYLQHHEEIIN